MSVSNLKYLGFLKGFLYFALNIIPLIGFSASMTKVTNSGSNLKIEDMNESQIKTIVKNEILEKEQTNEFYVSTNFIDLSRGNGNLTGDFFMGKNIAANIGFHTSSAREKVKLSNSDDRDAVDLAVDRSSYILGASFFPLGLNNKFNLIVNPGLAFGTKKTALDVENQTGIALKVSCLIKTNSKLGIEVGMKGNNLDEGSFTTNLHAGVGLLF